MLNPRPDWVDKKPYYKQREPKINTQRSPACDVCGKVLVYKGGDLVCSDETCSSYDKLKTTRYDILKRRKT